MPDCNCETLATTHCKICGKNNCPKCPCPNFYPITIDPTYYFYCSRCHNSMATSGCGSCTWNVCNKCCCACWDDIQGGGCECEGRNIDNNTDLIGRIAEIDKEMTKLVKVKEELEQRQLKEIW